MGTKGLSHEYGAEFWLLVWFLGYAAGAMVALRDRDYRGVFDLVVVGMVSGLSSFGLVGVLSWFVGTDSADGVFLLAVSTCLGLSGVRQDRMIRAAVKKVFLGVLGDVQNEQGDRPGVYRGDSSSGSVRGGDHIRGVQDAGKCKGDPKDR